MSAQYENLVKISTVPGDKAKDFSASYFINLAQKHPLVKKLLDYAECKASKNNFAKITFQHESDDSLGSYSHQWIETPVFGKHKVMVPVLGGRYSLEKYRYIETESILGYKLKLKATIEVKDLKMGDIFIHELTHAVINQLFKNRVLPFTKPAQSSKKLVAHKSEAEYKDAIAKTITKITDQQDNPFPGLLPKVDLDKISDYFVNLIPEFYDPDYRLQEYIVKLPEALVSHSEYTSHVEEMMEPLVQYFDNYIIPLIDADLSKNCPA